MAVEFVPNPAFMAELERSPEVAAMLQLRAEIVASEAKAIAPVGSDRDPHPGQFRDSISSDLAEARGLPAGRVYSDDPAAAYIIAGTSDTPAHDTFAKAIEATAAGPAAV